MNEQVYFSGTGRRKTSIAQVRLVPGKGTITVNNKPYEELFSREEYRRSILRPFAVTDTAEKFDATVKVTGGGTSGQVGAIIHGLSRAIVKINESYKPMLREQGLLTRDPRAKERKKYGLRRARKAPQYTKR